MVITRNGCVVHPGIKETGSRPTSKRIPELPSLRYGPIGAKCATSGPLRVTNHYHCDTIPKASSKKSNLHNYTSDDLGFRQIRTRRVRFALPPQDGDGVPASCVPALYGGSQTISSSVAAKQPAGDNNHWTRTRATSISSIQSRHRDRQQQQLYRSDESLAESRGGSNFFFGGGGGETSRTYADVRRELNRNQSSAVIVPVTASPGVRTRTQPTGRYVRGTLSPTANATAPTAPTPGGQVLLRAARDGDDALLRDILRKADVVGIPDVDLNATDNSGRTVLSYVVSNGSVDVLDEFLRLPGLDPNRPDNEGNTPLHFAAQAGQVECLSCILSRCRGVEIDARNHLGFTPLMKAALQGRNKCAKLLLFAGANPTLRDNGRGLRADQWARFCGRYVCADVIEKHARQRLLERSTSYGNWGGENEMGTRMIMGKVVPVPQIAQQQQQSNGLKSKLRKVFRTSSGPGHNNDNISSARLVTQLTTAALCASTPVLPSGPTVPPVVKSLIRPLTVPKLQITLVSNGGDHIPLNGLGKIDEIKPVRTKKKK